MKKSVRLKDLLLIVSIPAILTLVFLLPQSIQNSLAVDYGNPKIYTFYTFILVHGGIFHLSGNLIVYLVCVIPAYVMTSLMENRRTFRYLFLIYILLLPFAISGIDSLYLANTTEKGFSGIASAFVGFLPVIIFEFLKEKVDNRIKTGSSLSLLLVAVAIISITLLGSTLWSIISFILITATAVAVLWSQHKNLEISKIKKSLKDEPMKKNYLSLGLLSVVPFLLSIRLLFPADIIAGGRLINILAHYSGIILGFSSGYIIFQNFDLSSKSD